MIALAGKSQVLNNLQKQISGNSILAVNENSFFNNAVIFQDNFFDEQGTNDFDGFDCLFVLPDSYYYSQKYEIRSLALVLLQLQLIHLNELLLDLPPPLLSV
jgi:hypothetical protein